MQTLELIISNKPEYLRADTHVLSDGGRSACPEYLVEEGHLLKGWMESRRVPLDLFAIKSYPSSARSFRNYAICIVQKHI